MVRISLFAVALTLSFGVASAQEKKPALDPAKLVGKWTVTAGIKDGTASAAEAIKDTTIIIEKDKLTLKTSIGDFVMKYTVDPKATPAALDLEITDAPDAGAKGSKSKGIISLDGETMKLSYHPMGGERPKDFDAKKGTGHYSFTAKMVKAEKKDKK